MATCQAGTSPSQAQASAGVPLGTLDSRGVLGAIKRAREEQSGACTAATRAPWNSGSPHNVVGSPPTWHHRKQAKTRSGYARVARRSRCWRVTSVSRRRRRQPRPKLGAKRCINVINMHHLKTDHAADILPAAHVRADASPHCVPPTVSRLFVQGTGVQIPRRYTFSSRSCECAVRAGALWGWCRATTCSAPGRLLRRAVPACVGHHS